MLKYIALYIGLIAAGLTLNQPTKAAGELYVVTTTAQIADIARNVSGNNVRIVNLMGSGVDPHLYRPTRSDILKLKKADIVFYNGLHLEGQMVRIFDSLEDKKPVIGLADHLPETMLLTDAQQKHDPHVWMNVKAWMNSVSVIENTISTYDVGNAPHYAKRAAIYNKKLGLLDAHIKAVIKTIPKNDRILVTAHDAFGYFGRAYGIDVVGIQGLSTESEAGLKRMEELSTLLSSKKIPAIFSETSVSARNINALIEGTKAKGHSVTLGGALYSDAMGPDQTYEGTYIGMMEHNVRTLTEALGGTPNPFVYEDTYADASFR